MEKKKEKAKQQKSKIYCNPKKILNYKTNILLPYKYVLKNNQIRQNLNVLVQ